MVVPSRPKTNSEKSSLLPLNEFINVAPNLIELKQLLQGCISINNIHNLQEIYAASTQVVLRMILANSTNPAKISDSSIRHIIQEDTLTSTKHESDIDISSTVLSKSLNYHHSLPVNDKYI